MPKSEIPDTPRIYLLMFDAGGSGGVARTVINLANHLACTHHVELLSLYRHDDQPRFSVDPRVKLTFLHDVRSPRASRFSPRAYLDRRPTRLQPEPSETKMSLLTDLLLWRKLNSLRSGILISTRPSLHLAAARFAPRRLITIGQDHRNFPTRYRNRRQVKVLRTAIPRLDAYSVLTNADADDYRRDMPGADTCITVIRNAVPWPISDTPATLENKVVLAAGRLSAEKGFQRLIHAYEPIARTHPEWQLHIYGDGDERAALASLITRKGLSQQVLLKGYTGDLRSMLAGASVFAMSSLNEGFPMVLIEAMSTGLPLVSFDCPRGPAEIIGDDRNGRLVPDGDVAAFTSSLRELIDNGELRRRLGAQALEDAGQYGIDEVVAEWERLFAQIAGRRRG